MNEIIHLLSIACLVLGVLLFVGAMLYLGFSMSESPHGLIVRDGGESGGDNDIRRDIMFDRASLDGETRTVKAILSTETPIKTYYRGDFVREILDHSAEAVDLSRAESGLPLLFQHDRDRQIGVIRGIRIEDRKLVGDLTFSRNAFADEIYQDVQDGIRNHLSISAARDKVEDSEDDGVIRTTRWTPYEASVVSVPADHKATVQRDDRGSRGGDNVSDFVANRDRILEDGRKAGAEAERKRQAKIREIFGRHVERSALVRDMMDDCIARGVTVEVASEKLLDILGQDLGALARDYQQDDRGGSQDRGGDRAARTTGGEDQVDKFVDGATIGILARAGMITDEAERKKSVNNEFRGMRLDDMARRYLEISGARLAGDRRQLVSDAFLHRAITHGTSDFTNILENVARKAMLMGWGEAEETWNIWCRIGNLADFKVASRLNMSEFPDLDLVPASGEYKYAKMLDSKETIQLATYGKLFSISRQAIINDDVDAFTRVPRLMARAANRKVGDLAYAQLTGNPTLNQDSTALFHANHGNLKASGSTAPSVARVNAIRAAMATQRGLQAATEVATPGLGIRPSFLITPVVLEGTGKALVEAQYDPAGTAGTLTPNTVRGTFTVVSDYRLDAASATAYYMAANQNIYDTVEVAFLDGNPEPYLEEQNGWTVDGREFKVRIDAAAAALDYRGLYKDIGTT